MIYRLFFLGFFSLAFTASNLSAQKNELWGMTTGGQGSGTIFKTDSIGEHMELVYDFIKQGKSPKRTHFVQYSNNRLYAVAQGGKYGVGVIFEFDQYNSVYTKKFDFFGETTGSIPVGGLLLASNGKLYGMCKYGGQSSVGVIYEYNPSIDSFRVVFNFDTLGSGNYPEGGLIQATNGKLYGLTSVNISSSQPNMWSGTLFEYDLTSQVFSTKVSFCDANATRPNIGSHPMGDLIQAPNGKLYGMTQYGGTDTVYNGGLIFEYDIVMDTLIVKHSFNNSYQNNNPDGTLVLASNGKMYGYSGSSLFEFNPQNNQVLIKHTFNFQLINNGYWPVDRLVKGNSGKLYGVCRYGGSAMAGVLFEFNPANGQYVKKVEFDNGSKGGRPEGALFLASNGIFYGMAPVGGLNGQGVIFEFNPTFTNVFVKNYDFISAPFGSNPYGSLLYASNNKFYGMTKFGGIYNQGVLFEYDPATFTYIKKIDFNSSTGHQPTGSLIEASNGKLYAMTTIGTGQNIGVLFEYNIQTDSFSIKKQFYGHIFGGMPFGSVIEVDSTKLFGMTSTYLGDNGGIFEYNMNTGVCYPRYGFGYWNSGASKPEGSLIKINNALLQGLTKKGGTNNLGTLFDYYTLAKTTTVKHSFNGTNGAYPTGDLCKASNGKLYGLTSAGGAYNQGVIFEYSGVIFNKKVDFKTDSIGGIPHGTLMQASNGKLYGMTHSGGTYNKGVLFEYDPNNNQYMVKTHFDGRKGANPYYTKLVERDACSNVTFSSMSALVCNQYISPSGKIWTQSGIYKDTVSNRFYCDSIITINLIVSHVDTSVSIQGATLSANFNGGIYQWLDCNAAYKPVLNANNQSFTPSANGLYAVMILGNGCIDTSSCYAVNTVGIVENSFKSDIKVFPNPTTGKFSIMLGAEYGEIELSMRNAMGKLIYQQQYIETNSIDMNINAAKGIYLIELRDAKGRRLLIKIIKE